MKCKFLKECGGYKKGVTCLDYPHDKRCNIIRRAEESNTISIPAWAVVTNGNVILADRNEAPTRVPCRIVIDKKYLEEK